MYSRIASELRCISDSFSPEPVNSFKFKELQSNNWKCHLCLEDGIKSIAIDWCHDCKQLHCPNCSRIHEKLQNKFNLKHTIRDLTGMKRGAVLRIMATGTCSKHQKEEDSYCERCNVCFCDICYQDHSADSPGCSSQPLSLMEEAVKQRSQGSTLAREMDDLEMSLKTRNKKMRNYTEELSSDCESKCNHLRQNLEEIIENARQKTKELCKEMRQITTEQVKRYCHLLEENEKILKELGKWRINLHHLLNDSQQDMDVVYGLRSLRSELSSRLHKLVGPENKCELGITFSNWWLQVTKQMGNEPIGSIALTFELPAKNFEIRKQFNLFRSDITSIQCDENNHVFVSDYNRQSVVEFTEQGELVCECLLVKGKNTFTPWDMCSISRNQFAVACGLEKKIIFLEKIKNPSSLQIMKIIPTNEAFLSLCEIKESIFACDDSFQVDSFTKEGTKIKTILTGESRGGFWPRIRADPSTGNFWGTKLDSSEICCYNPNGEKLRSVKTGEEITDICVEEFGYFYFCNYEGIFSFSPKNVLYKFERKSEKPCRIFALANNIFVCFRNDGKYVFKMFEEVQLKHSVGESIQHIQIEKKNTVLSSLNTVLTKRLFSILI